MDNEINFQGDFLAFREEIIAKFGEQYFDQTKIFFERAYSQREQGLLHSANADAKFALELSHYTTDYRIVYLLGFLSQLNCDLGKLNQARAYYELGIKLLDPADEDYEDDMELFARLKELLDGESWKGALEDNDN